MINHIQLLKNIGRFDYIDIADKIQFKKNAVIFAENTRGKTTISEIFRSLSNNDTTLINERKRLNGRGKPHIVLDVGENNQKVVFQDGKWNQNIPDIKVFDDIFVDENVFSGLSVQSAHRQNLHGLILGRKGVELAKTVEELVFKINEHNQVLRKREKTISTEYLHGMTVDKFCDLIKLTDIEEKIKTATQKRDAIVEQDQLVGKAKLSSISLPKINDSAILDLLQSDIDKLDTIAVSRVEEHLNKVGEDSEAWVSDGVSNVYQEGEEDVCPFCAQNLTASPIFTYYRQYFSDAYKEIKNNVSQMIIAIEKEHNDNATASFERSVRRLVEHCQFWSRYCNVPEIKLDTKLITEIWSKIRDEILNLLRRKHAEPLEILSINEDINRSIRTHESNRSEVHQLNVAIEKTNVEIDEIKKNTANSDLRAAQNQLNTFLAVKDRFIQEVDKACQEYINERNVKKQTERKRDDARAQLDKHRVNAFPEYAIGVNKYLDIFGVDFSVEKVEPVNPGGKPSCIYCLRINNMDIEVSGSPPIKGKASFKNTLSAGDRNTLAFAFFLADIDRDEQIQDRIVVIDDPISSMDENRRFYTRKTIADLSRRVKQLIILSHSKPFLLNFWNLLDEEKVAMKITRKEDGSVIKSWDVDKDSITDYDRNYAILQEYEDSETENSREVAIAIRPVLEGYLRVACTNSYPPGMMLGQFCQIAKDRLGSGKEIINKTQCRMLEDLIKYANKFHHDTSTNYARELDNINDTELLTFVRSALDFVHP